MVVWKKPGLVSSKKKSKWQKENSRGGKGLESEAIAKPKEADTSRGKWNSIRKEVATNGPDKLHPLLRQHGLPSR